MMSEWSKRQLADVSTVVDCEHRTAPQAMKGEEFGYSIGTTDIKGGRVDYQTAKRVSRSVFTEWSRRAVLGEGDIVLAREAPVGQVARVNPSYPTCLGQRTVLIRPNRQLINDCFLHGYLLGREAQKWMAQRSTGSTVAHLNVADVREIPVMLPSLDEQLRIAAVLGSFDDLVEVDRSIITHLRALSASAFDYASTDGDSVRFGDIATQVRDSVNADELEAVTPYIGLEHFGTDGVGLNSVGDASSVDSNKSRFHAGDVLYGRLRPYFRKVDRPGFDGVCSTEIWVLQPKPGWGAATLHAVVARKEFTDFAMAGRTGTRMPRADWDHVCSMPVKVPLKHRLADLDRSLDVFWQSIVALQDEIAELTRARDELLPLLMSGRITISPDIEVDE